MRLKIAKARVYDYSSTVKICRILNYVGKYTRLSLKRVK